MDINIFKHIDMNIGEMYGARVHHMHWRDAFMMMYLKQNKMYELCDHHEKQNKMYELCDKQNFHEIFHDDVCNWFWVRGTLH